MSQDEVPPPPQSMAQVVVAVEAVLRGLRGLQASGAMLGDPSSQQAAWERDLRAREEELQHRKEQVQLAQVDVARHEEAMAMQERCLEEELGTIPTREQDLAACLVELEEG